ncbi:MAG: molybdopterin-dependent oxidoreductase [Chloroflexi bacterium]|nr:molybdopterin-dependent oxidoreductase [Chloroflexota bacterium]
MSDQNFLVNAVTNTVLNRRTFLKWNAALGGTAVLAKGGLSFGLEAANKVAAQTDEKIVWSACTVNCGSRCPVRLHVRDGVVVRVETDNTGDDEFGQHQVRCCVRGRSVRQRIYNSDRLKYPMKRVGKRGEGKFERISWEEAFDTIAEKLKNLVEQYGNESIYLNYGTGTLGALIATSWPPGATAVARLMNCYGGYLNHYGDYSAAQIESALPYTFGNTWADTWVTNNSIEDVVNTKLMVYFGNNPGETRMSGGGMIYSLQHYKRVSGAKLIVIDPRYTDTAVSAADEWIPIRPGTDAALVSAMAYVMITEDLHDQEFLDKYCVGFDKEHMPEGYEDQDSYKDYILGTGADGVAKTPEWAATITGVPAGKIIQLAREIALSKPCFVTQGWGPQRQANGEQNSRAIPMISILTGNIGIPGGGTGARESGFGIYPTGFPTLANPVKTYISVFNWPDAITHGPEMTALKDGVIGKDKLDVPIKFIWNYAGNCLINQHAEVNLTKSILEDDTLCEMIVVIDVHMTPSAKFADILLPDTTSFEKLDIAVNGDTSSMGYAIFCEPAIEPMFETMHVYDMCAEIAKRLGVEEQFTEGRTVEDWLRYCVDETRKNNPDWPDFESFREMGIYKVTNPGEPYVAYQAFREDPEANPLITPSGKLEIFSARLHDIGQTWELEEGDVITGLPIYAETWEGLNDPLREKYPLQLISAHYKQRTHSTYGNVPWMKEAAPQVVWINPIDAEPRGINNGDMVVVYNDRGRSRVSARVTPRIIPGVAHLSEGAWYSPDSDGVDQSGCANILTRYRPSPLAKGDPMHTCLVQVEKA